MAELYKFFNSTVDDPRKYGAGDFAEYLGTILSTGLLHIDKIPGLKVHVEPGTLQTYVTTGKAIMRGHLYENTTSKYLAHFIPEPQHDRIDRIVLRLDLRSAQRNILLHVKEGAPANVPVPPELQRDDFIHELSLAQIRVRANTSTLLPGDLIDERLDESLCGIVYSLLSVPTDIFLDKIKGLEAEWQTWFDGLQSTLPNAAALVSIDDPNDYFAAFNVNEALTELYKNSVAIYATKRLNKDVNGTFTRFEKRRRDAGKTLVASSVLCGGTSPKYTTRTVNFYDRTGLVVVSGAALALTYDVDGDYISEE